MSIDIRDNTYSDIISQFPDHYKENSQFLIEFIEAYYQYNELKMDRDIPRLRDIDTTITAFLIFYKRKYLADLPFSGDVDIRFVLKHIQDLYTRKGSEQSLQLLFKIFFNEDIEIKFPGRNVLRSSDSLWRFNTFLEMKAVYSEIGYPIQRGNTIRGDLSQASAFVDDIIFITLSGALTPIVYLSNLKGEFRQADALEVISATPDNVETRINVGKLINGSISEANVNRSRRLPLNFVGDTVNLISSKIGQGAKGIVTKVNSDEIGSIDYELVDGGWGYIDPNTVSLEYYNDNGISNRVIVLEQDNVIDVEPGEMIIWPGSTIEYEGRTKSSPMYSVTGGAKVIAYRHPLLFIETRSTKDDLYDWMSQYYDTGAVDENGAAIYRSVIFDHMYNALLGSLLNTESGAAAYVPPPEYDRILSNIFFKATEDDTVAGNFVGGKQGYYFGDLDNLRKQQDNQDFYLFYYFQQTVNNGINDALLFEGAGTDFDTSFVSSSGAGDLGQVNKSQVDLDSGDRMPTIAPIGTLDYGGVIHSSPGGTTAGSIFPEELRMLRHGQFYTIEHLGNCLTTADWELIGVPSGKNVIGHDFIFDSKNIHLLSGAKNFEFTDTDIDFANNTITLTNAGVDHELELNDFVTFQRLTGPSLHSETNPHQGMEHDRPYKVIRVDGQTIKLKQTGSNNEIDILQTEVGAGTYRLVNLMGDDSFFSNQKQIFGRFYNYLALNNLTPSITIGQSLETPPAIPAQVSELYPAQDEDGNDIGIGAAHPNAGETDWEWYDAYHVPTDSLVPGRKYKFFDFGSMTYQNMVDVGLTGLFSEGLEQDILNSRNTSTLVGRRKYIIQDLGTFSISDWQKVGASSNPQVGDIFTATLPQPTITAADLTFADTQIDTQDYATIEFPVAHQLGDQDLVTYNDGGQGGLLLQDLSTTITTGAVFYVQVVSPTRIKLYTDRDNFDQTTLVVFASTNSGTTANGLVKTRGNAEVIPMISLLHTEFTAADPQPSGIPSDGLCTDGIKVSVGADYRQTVSFNGVNQEVEFGIYNIGGTITDPIKDETGADESRIPDDIANLADINFTGFINGDHSRPVQCRQIGKFNDSTSFEVTAIKDSETVTLVPDIVGDVVLDRIFKQEYELTEAAFDDTDETITLTDDIDHGFIENKQVVFTKVSGSGSITNLTSGETYRVIVVDDNKIKLKPNSGSSSPINFTVNGTGVYKITEANLEGDRFKDGLFDLSGATIESLATEYRDAFARLTFTLGSIAELKEDNPGTEYENDVGVRVVNDVVARFNKKDVILRFDDDNFQLRIGEVVEQEREIEDTSVDAVNGLSPAQALTIAASTTEKPESLPPEVAYGISTTTFSIENEKYTAKAKFLKRVEQDFYFRPISFYLYDTALPLNIQAQDRNIISMGQDQDSLPMGANAVIEGNVKYDTGQIDEIVVTHTGYKYQDNEVVTMINTTPGSPRENDIVGNVTLRTLGQGNTKGKWKTRSSFVGHDLTKIHDNDYYQEYSYDISSIINPEIYTPLVKNIVGVAGTKMFSTPLINSDNPMQSNVDAEVQRFDIRTDDLVAEGTGSLFNAAEDLNDQPLKTEDSGGEQSVNIKAVTIEESEE